MPILCLSGIALVVCLGLAARWLPTVEPKALVALLLAFIPYSVAVWQAQRLAWRRTWPVIILFALTARATMVAAPYVLSDDAYRYHWEGTVQRAGLNPFRYAPDAPVLEPFRDANWRQTAHRNIPSAYPPLALTVFRLGSAVSSNAAVFKWIFGAFDCATILLLAGWLRARGQNQSAALVWAWNPLVILEFAGMGHEMSLAIFFLVAGLWALESVKSAGVCSLRSMVCSPVVAGVLFACVILSQLFAVPVVVAVVLARRIRTTSFWLSFLVILMVATLPFLDAGPNLWLGLLHFGAEWKFNGSIFSVLAWVFENDRPRQLAANLWLTHAMAKYLATGGLLVVLGWIAYRRYDPARAALISTAAVLLLSPTVHPWYVTWIVALLVIQVNPAWLVFSAAVLLAYLAKLTQLLDGQWTESALVSWLEYTPVFAWLLVDVWRDCRPNGLPRITRMNANSGDNVPHS